MAILMVLEIIFILFVMNGIDFINGCDSGSNFGCDKGYGKMSEEESLNFFGRELGNIKGSVFELCNSTKHCQDMYPNISYFNIFCPSQYNGLNDSDKRCKCFSGFGLTGPNCSSPSYGTIFSLSLLSLIVLAILSIFISSFSGIHRFFKDGHLENNVLGQTLVLSWLTIFMIFISNILIISLLVTISWSNIESRASTDIVFSVKFSIVFIHFFELVTIVNLMVSIAQAVFSPTEANKQRIRFLKGIIYLIVLLSLTLTISFIILHYFDWAPLAICFLSIGLSIVLIISPLLIFFIINNSISGDETLRAIILQEYGTKNKIGFCRGAILWIVNENIFCSTLALRKTDNGSALQIDRKNDSSFVHQNRSRSSIGFYRFYISLLILSFRISSCFFLSLICIIVLGMYVHDTSYGADSIFVPFSFLFFLEMVILLIVPLLIIIFLNRLMHLKSNYQKSKPIPLKSPIQRNNAFNQNLKQANEIIEEKSISYKKSHTPNQADGSKIVALS